MGHMIWEILGNLNSCIRASMMKAALLPSLELFTLSYIIDTLYFNPNLEKIHSTIKTTFQICRNFCQCLT